MFVFFMIYDMNWVGLVVFFSIPFCFINVHFPFFVFFGVS